MILLKSDIFDIIFLNLWIGWSSETSHTFTLCFAYMLHAKYLGEKLTHHEKDIVLQLLSSIHPSSL